MWQNQWHDNFSPGSSLMWHSGKTQGAENMTKNHSRQKTEHGASRCARGIASRQEGQRSKISRQANAKPTLVAILRPTDWLDCRFVFNLNRKSGIKMFLSFGVYSFTSSFASRGSPNTRLTRMSTHRLVHIPAVPHSQLAVCQSWLCGATEAPESVSGSSHCMGGRGRWVGARGSRWGGRVSIQRVDTPPLPLQKPAISPCL